MFSMSVALKKVTATKLSRRLNMALILNWRKYCEADFKLTISAIVGNNKLGLNDSSTLKGPKVEIFEFVSFNNELMN
jgi:hypothetical protein